MPASPPVVSLRGVGKQFSTGTLALDGLDLDVRDGEFVSLLGPSGCGKSTALRIIAGLSEPSRGSVTWQRRDRGAIGFVFQDPTLMPWARVAANVRLPLDLAGVERAQSASRVEQALARVGLAGFGRHYPRQLSGGMKMRVSIARSLITDPDLLLMDEPFGALDEFTRNRLDADLVRLWWERKLTTVFVTHSIYEAVFLSTRVAVMGAQPGRIFKTLAIDAPHPRDEGFRNSPRFAEYCRALSALLTEVSLAQLQR
jgi:NitT/TauT family transport system ATP-binding protein